MALPIVFVHKGDSFYLKHAVNNARKFNPDSKIYLIADGTKENFEGVEKLDLKDFDKYSSEFENLYVHKTKSNPEIERFCISRWLILLEFMQKKRIDSIFTMDSDVLIFENVSTDLINYKKFDFSLAKGSAAGSVFINNKKVLIAYCDLVLDFYKNKVGKVEYELNKTITDMSFWKELKRRQIFKCAEVTTPIDNAVYDAGLLIDQNEIIMKEGQKQIIFEKGLPYAKTKTGLLRLKCIHCQGPTKFYMKYYSLGKITFLDILNVKLMMWFRDKFSSIIPNKIRLIFKTLLSRFGF